MLELNLEENKESNEEQKSFDREDTKLNHKTSLNRSSDFKDALGFTNAHSKEKVFCAQFDLIDQSEFHFWKAKSVYLNKLMAEMIKIQAKREQHLLCDLYEIKRKEFDENSTTADRFIGTSYFWSI